VDLGESKGTQVVLSLPELYYLIRNAWEFFRKKLLEAIISLKWINFLQKTVHLEDYFTECYRIL